MNKISTAEFLPSIEHNYLVNRISKFDYPIEYFLSDIENTDKKGFIIVDQITGEEVTFALYKTHTNIDDEITGWVFEEINNPYGIFVWIANK